MRNRFLRLLIVPLILLLTKNITNAQTVQSTHGELNCTNCFIPGWSSINLSSSASIGSSTGPEFNTKWVDAGENEISQPVSPSGGAGVGWLTVQTLENWENGASSEITGLVPGRTYTLTYHVLSAKEKEFDDDGEEQITGYGKSATLTIKKGGNVVASKTFEFGNVFFNQWVKQKITFVAPAEDVSIIFTGSAYGDNHPAFSWSEFGNVCLDIAGSSALKKECVISPGQVPLAIGSQIMRLPCPDKTVNLNSAFQGTPPAGTELVWFDNQQHIGDPIADPTAVGVGAYFAFFKDPQFDCYNEVTSTSSVLVKEPVQVQLAITDVKLDCTYEQFDLSTAFKGVLPNGAKLGWWDNPTHSGTQIITKPPKVGPGTYYAFFDYGNSCLNVAHSSASVTVVRKIPVLTAGSIKNVCPVQTVNLNATLSEPVPSGYELHWFTNATHSGSRVANPQAAATGATYYAFYFDIASACHTWNVSTSIINAVANQSCLPCNAGSNQVMLTSKNISVCPGSTVNLNNYFTGNLPAGTSLIWFNNPSHTMPVVKNPATVSLGEYYAFIYDLQNNCYNTTASTAKLTVSAGVCAIQLNGERNARLTGEPNANGVMLEQNVPNGFSEHTVIKYFVPQHVKEAVINIYSITGSKIASFPVKEKGAGELKLSAAQLATGTLIYDLITDGVSNGAKRMIVNK